MWRDEESLWRSVLDRHDEDEAEGKLESARRAHYNYGRALLRRAAGRPMVAEKARLEIAQGAHLVPGGQALLVKLALMAGDGLGVLASGRRLIGAWSEGDEGAGANLRPVLEMMDRAMLLPLGRETAESWSARAMHALGRDPDVRRDPQAGRYVLFRLWRLRARIQRRAGRRERAIEAYGRVLDSIGVRDFASYVERARLYLERGDLDGRRRARADFETALALGPSEDLAAGVRKELAALGEEGR